MNLIFMKDIRQSQVFAGYMQDLGWEIMKIDKFIIYLRRFPIIGYFAKIPRPNLPIDQNKILEFKNSRKIFRLKISPFIGDTDKNYQRYRKQFLHNGFKIENFPFNPTTNYLIDLTQTKKNIFNNFTESKRRAVRRAIKNGIYIKETPDLESFIEIRKKQYSFVGFLVKSEMIKLWKNLHPQNASLLLAYPTIQNQKSSQIQATASICYGKPVAGILLLFYDRVAYYWFASSLKVGKKLFTPTLLVWEALKLAKKKGCKIFDFEGIYDERFPKASESWKGFTKFKEGFGGKKVVYMENFYL